MRARADILEDALRFQLTRCEKLIKGTINTSFDHGVNSSVFRDVPHREAVELVSRIWVGVDGRTCHDIIRITATVIIILKRFAE